MDRTSTRKGQEHPRKEVSDQVRLMAAIGIPTRQIAGKLFIGMDTLYNHYKHELDYGAVDAAVTVGGKIFERAKEGEHWACALWASRKMGPYGWAERPHGDTIHIEVDIAKALNDRLKHHQRLGVIEADVVETEHWR